AAGRVEGRDSFRTGCRAAQRGAVATRGGESGSSEADFRAAVDSNEADSAGVTSAAARGRATDETCAGAQRPGA
ncbi:MAG: hypothetical protein J0H22_04960, partial [Actinobacteria bacterium]|nr:hypothetical protein [Actinomycetota bacterium]